MNWIGAHANKLKLPYIRTYNNNVEEKKKVEEREMCSLISFVVFKAFSFLFLLHAYIAVKEGGKNNCVSQNVTFMLDYTWKRSKKLVAKTNEHFYI